MNVPPTGLTEETLERLRAARHWVFDLDGTLTVAMHDFASLRRAIGCPAGAPILEWLAGLPGAEREAKVAQLDALEAELCDGACPAEGALELVDALRRRHCALGVLTRNSRSNALRTLNAIGLLDAFDPVCVLGRDEAAAKPDCAGLRLLSRDWQVASQELVVVGDYLFDLQAGRAAGALTVHADPGARDWPAETDLRVHSLTEVARLLNAG